MGDAYRPELGSAEAPEPHSGLRPAGAISIAEEALGVLAWIIQQAESAMALSQSTDGDEDDLGLLSSIASDIAINAEMLSEKIAAGEN